MNKIIWSTVFLCFIGTGFCVSGQDSSLEKQEYTSSLNLTYMDTTISPAEDFYQFVNGSWLKNSEIPEDRGRWGSFDELRKKTSQNTLKVLERAMDDASLEKGSPEYKAVTFYTLAMDTTYLDEIGFNPILPLLDKIDALVRKDQVFNYIAENMPIVGNPFFVFFVRSSFTNSSMNTLYLSPSGLGMPERDYYLNDDSESLATQAKYREVLTDIFSLIKIENISTAAAQVYQLEKSLAGERMTKEERRNPDNINNVMTVEELEELFPQADIRQILEKQGISDIESLTVTDPGYFKGLKKIFEETPLEAMKVYLKWMVITSYRNYLGSDIERLAFQFYGKELRGTDAMLPRWERVLNTANRALDQAIGQLYVEEYFPPEAKEAAVELVDNIKSAFRERIEDLDWMTKKTKEKALKKLSTFNVKIAYPDEWKDYSKLTIKSKEEGGSYAENMMLISLWNWERKKKEINKPVDKSEWFMGPQIVNAYFSPSFNEIVFPAAILQAPFFDFQADPAVNYGGIGAVIGHEVSHGFDDSGSKYDAYGNLHNWWTEEDRDAFEQRTDALVKQFDDYKPFEDLAVNGTFTLGENIGDLGGTNVAYQALQHHLRQHGNPGKIDGFTQDQRFFMSWATIWRTKYKDEALRTQIKTDPHAPGMYRAVGPIMNMDEFFEAFDIVEGDPMYKAPENRVKIW